MTLLKEYAMCLVGALISAFAMGLFLAPNSVATGGAGGLGIVLYSGFSIPVSITVAIVNITLFTIGYRKLEKSVLIKTFLSTFFLVVFIELLSHLGSLTEDVFIASVFGGILLGIGTGLVIKSGASTGGSDFAAMLLHRKFRHKSVSSLIMIIDFSVIFLSWFSCADPTNVLYAFIGLFVTVKAIDFVVEGASYSKLVFIISDEYKDISEYILLTLKRGVTELDGIGSYSMQRKHVLMCAVSTRQFVNLKNYVTDKDKNAFIILSDARSVFGKGFKME